MAKKNSSQGPVTKINKMEMKGFKSFANKISVPFGEEFNCILGPNGSGKSNVLDSLCFVLGKSGAKSMRAEKTANLIYNGGKSKKPAKQGEVHIYFDNHKKTFPVDKEEIKISRVVKQSGQSAYLINDEKATRTQITDLLSHAKINPDGYNIILQGDIVKLVEMSPVERRSIIEEISGISIYEEKKTKATRELDRVEEQLREAEIVLTERNTYLKELKKERDQAMKFKELDEKIKRNKATILTRKQSEKQKTLADIEKQMADEKAKIDQIQQKIDNLKEQILEKKRLADDVSREIEEKGEKEQVALLREVENLKVDVALKKQRQGQVKQELQRILDRRKELEKGLKTVQDKIVTIEKSITVSEKKIQTRQNDTARLNEKIDKVRKKHDLSSASDIDKQVHDLDKEAEVLVEDIQKLRENQQDLFREKDKIEYQISVIDEKVNKVLEAQKENKQQLQQLKANRTRLQTVEKELNQKLDRSSALVSEIQTAKGKLETRHQELITLQARQTRIMEQAAGSAAVKAILDMRKTNKKIYGTVAELGSVSQKYSMAMEVAAGSRVRSIVVEDDVTAQKCIDYLKKSRLGIATFLPLNKLQTRQIPTELRTAKGKGVHGLAVDIVKYDKKFEKAFLHVLGPTLIVDDIDSARKFGIGRTRMTTISGDLIESSGAMSGGYRKKGGTGAAFQEQEVSGKIDALEKEVADYQAVVGRLTQEQQASTLRIDDLRAERHELESSVLQLERELHIDSADVDASKDDKKRLREEGKKLDGKVDDITAEISSKNKRLALVKMEKAKLRDKLTQLRSPQALAELNTFEQQKQRISEEIVQLKTEMQGLRNQISAIHTPELENTNAILQQMQKEESSFKQEQQELKQTIQTNESDLKGKQKAVEAFQKQFKELFNKRSKLQGEVESLEQKTIAEEERIRRAEHTMNASSIKRAQVAAELAGVEEELKDYAGVEPFKTKPLDDIKLEIKQFERMVSDMGAVNMKALEMYEHVKKEYDSLVEKKEVLGKEREDVLVLINEIDAKKRELFLKTFTAIEDHFKNIFSHLSTKGEAFLELEEPDDPFAGGLNIRVRLTGKKFMDIRSLSGGEKTMTALAFLFAVQEFQPASFYILDEVDAALDKKNSERLASLVRAYSDKAQYIIISHNDGVISEADHLFGVSMNEHGESKVTSLEL